MTADDRLMFTSVSVGGAPPVQLCVDPAGGDPVVPWLLEHDWIDEPVQRAFLGLVTRGARVLDLGCHVGLFSLAAAALGAEVIAVDASPRHVDLVRLAATRNGFTGVHAVNAALSDGEEPVAFHENAIHGRLWREDDDAAAHTIEVQPVTVDELLAQRGWDRVDVVKLDVEGAEMAAVRGMRALHRRGARPAIVFECNGSTLPLFGHSTRALRRELEQLGYELLMIDHLRPGTLVRSSADTVQPECVTDYVAHVGRLDDLAAHWTIEPPMGREQTLTRLLDGAASPAQGYRAYSADVLAGGPRWLRAHPLADAGLRALELDVDHGVRMAVGRRAPDPLDDDEDWAPSEEPASDLVVQAERVALRARSAEPERPLERTGRDGELVLRDLSLHVRAGQALAVLADDPAAATTLLRALAGLDQPVRGDLHVRGRPTLLAAIGEGLEAGLTVAENIALFAAYLGAHTTEVAGRVTELGERAGVEDALGRLLGDVPAETAVRLAITVALECAPSALMLVDALPTVDDPTFRDRVRDRACELRGAGTAFVQVVTDPSQMLVPADRMLWLADGEVRACGHAASILDAATRRRIRLFSVHDRRRAAVAAR